MNNDRVQAVLAEYDRSVLRAGNPITHLRASSVAGRNVRQKLVKNRRLTAAGVAPSASVYVA